MKLFIDSFLPALFFLVAGAFLTGTLTALRRLGKLEVESEGNPNRPFFFCYPFNEWMFKEKRWEGLFFSLSITKQLFHLCYGLSAFFFLLFQKPFSNALKAEQSGVFFDLGWIFILAGTLLFVSILVNAAAHVLGLTRPKAFLKTTSFISFFFLFLTTPLTLPLFKIIQYFLPSSQEKEDLPTFRIRDKILEVFNTSDLSRYLDVQEQKLILSIVSFKERVVREVIVPRINIFCLSSETTIEEACQSLLREGYSRIPVYKDSIDNILGVVHYKSLFNAYFDAQGKEALLKQSIENLVKPVLYTPETKKISYLLQEFRSKQIHLAIVVDEYGGTEGIVTIEDILEELVGEISDEYDKEENALFTILPSGGWIVDAKMSIIDIEEELGIKIPHSPEYDTIGGYIFHRAGAIPSQGWRIHHDTFDLEVLSSTERALGKIRITSHK